MMQSSLINMKAEWKEGQRKLALEKLYTTCNLLVLVKANRELTHEEKSILKVVDQLKMLEKGVP